MHLLVKFIEAERISKFLEPSISIPRSKKRPLLVQFIPGIWRFLHSILHTPIHVNNLLALHKQYTNCPTLVSGYEVGNLYKNLLFIRNIL